MSTSFTGGCQCGAIRFRANGPTNMVTNCHCRMCQRAHGAGVIAWAEFPSDQVTWEAQQPSWYRSSDIAERAFCPHCGSPLHFRVFDGKDTDIALAAFDDPDALMPADEIWTESQRAWVPASEHIPRHQRERG